MSGTPAPDGGYRIYYDQAGKLHLVTTASDDVTSFKDTCMTSRQSYTYLVTAWQECSGHDQFEPAADKESPPTGPVTAIAR